MVNIPNTNNKAQIAIISLAHKDSVSFFPYDFEFDDTYKPEWGTYEAFGRMDPIMTYKRTTRDVTLTFNVVAESQGMAINNFGNLKKLIKFLYPVYEDVSSGVYSAKQKELTKKVFDLSEAAQKATDEAAAKKAKADELLNNPNLEEGDIAQIQEDFDRESVFAAADSSVFVQELQASQRQITQIQQSSKALQSFGISVMQKSPLFQISFMNLLNEGEFVAAITNFKHKMKFEGSDSSLNSNGVAIPGEFNISITFKVLHTNIPGTGLNYTL